MYISFCHIPTQTGFCYCRATLKNKTTDNPTDPPIIIGDKNLAVVKLITYEVSSKTVTREKKNKQNDKRKSQRKSNEKSNVEFIIYFFDLI